MAPDVLRVETTDSANPINAHFWMAAAAAYGGHLAGAGGSYSIAHKPKHTAEKIAALAEALWREANDTTWRMTDGD